MINLNNYEVYMLDYLEGNLSQGEQEAVMVFLDQNPAIKEEVSDLMDFNLVATEGVVYENKKGLKRGQRGYIKYAGMLLLCLGGLAIYMMQNDTANEAPNNEIQEYKMPMDSSKDEEVEYAEVPTERINVAPTKSVEKVEESKEADLKSIANVERKSKDTNAIIPHQNTRKIDVNVEEIIMDTPREEAPVIYASNKQNDVMENQEERALENVKRRPQAVLATLETRTLSVDPSNIEEVDVYSLANSALLPEQKDPTLALSIKLGPFSSAKRKIQSFLENESVTAVREAVTPEYFAKN